MIRKSAFAYSVMAGPADRSRTTSKRIIAYRQHKLARTLLTAIHHYVDTRRRPAQYRQQATGLGLQHHRQRLIGPTTNCTFATTYCSKNLVVVALKSNEITLNRLSSDHNRLENHLYLRTLLEETSYREEAAL